MRKRLLSIILVMVMLLSMIPVMGVTAGQSITTLYFGENGSKAGEYGLYTNEARTDFYSTGFGTTWSVEWNTKAGLPQLNLNNFTFESKREKVYALEIPTSCVINVTGNVSFSYSDGSSKTKGVYIGKNCDVTLTGSGTINISSQLSSIDIKQSTLTVDGPTVKFKSAASFALNVGNGSSVVFKSGQIITDGKLGGIVGRSDSPIQYDADAVSFMAGSSSADQNANKELKSFEYSNNTYYGVTYGSEEPQVARFAEIKKIKAKVEFSCPVVSSKTQYINLGGKASNPDPDGLYTEGWYTDPEYTDGNEYDFDSAVNSDIVLYGKAKDTLNFDCLYLAKVEDGDYTLYIDKDHNNEYLAGRGTVWEVVDYTDVSSVKYAILRLSGNLDYDVVFEPGTENYIMALAVDGADINIKGIDAGDGVITVQKDENGVKLTAIGNIKGREIYLSEAGGLSVNITGSIIAGTDNAAGTVMIGNGASEADKVEFILTSGSISNEKGSVTIINSDVTIVGSGDTDSYGINAHLVNVDASTLKISGVDYGIKMYDPASGDADGAIVSLDNASEVEISAGKVGLKGTAGADFYNNVSVADTDSYIKVSGTDKAVASVVFEPIPSSDTYFLRSTDGRKVYFKVNDDNTTDYYYEGTLEAAKELLAHKNYTVYFMNGVDILSTQSVALGDHLTAPSNLPEGFRTYLVGEGFAGRAAGTGFDLTADTVIPSNIIKTSELDINISTEGEYECQTDINVPVYEAQKGVEYTLNLNGTAQPGKYIIRESRSGFLIKQAGVNGKFLAIRKGRIVLCKEPYSWDYDGGFYVAEEECYGRLWWKQIIVKKYYLADGLTISRSRVRATLTQHVENSEHSYVYTDNEDGTHTGTCTVCHKSFTTTHSYDETGRCVCGCENQAYTGVIGISVSIKKNVTHVRKGWTYKRVECYDYTIVPQLNGVELTKLEIQTGKYGWTEVTGGTFTNSYPLRSFIVRTTDSKGVVKTWNYPDQVVTKK